MLKKYLAASAAATVALGMGTLAPAQAAPQDVTFTCSAAGLVRTTIDLGTLPTTMVVGQTIPQATSIVVHLGQQQANLVATYGDKVGGTITNDPSSNPTRELVTFQTTSVPAPPAPFDVPGAGTTWLRFLHAGSPQVAAGNIIATLKVTKTSTGQTTTFPLTCTPPTDGTQNFGTVAVTKATTTTKASGTYKHAKRLLIAKAKVTSQYGSTVTGQVKLTLKKGTRTIGKAIVGLNSRGIATKKFKHVATGRYKVIANYLGNADYTASGAKAVVVAK